MAVLELDMLPTGRKKTALVVQTDKQVFRPPAKPVTDMNGRRMTQDEFCLAVRTAMLLLEKIKNRD
jgi:hypothetical protein